MKVVDILEAHLRDKGYAGLYRPECECLTGNLLANCREDESHPKDCEAGYKTYCPPGCEANHEHIPPGFLRIQAAKPKAATK